MTDDTTKKPQGLYAGLEKQIMRETKQSRPDNFQKSGNPEIQKINKRINYPKVGYRLRPEALDEVEEIKRVLRRDHNLNVTRESIVEEAIRLCLKELTDQKTQSKLVKVLSQAPGFQKSGDPES